MLKRPGNKTGIGMYTSFFMSSDNPAFGFGFNYMFGSSQN